MSNIEINCEECERFEEYVDVEHLLGKDNVISTEKSSCRMHQPMVYENNKFHPKNPKCKYYTPI